MLPKSTGLAAELLAGAVEAAGGAEGFPKRPPAGLTSAFFSLSEAGCAGAPNKPAEAGFGACLASSFLSDKAAPKADFKPVVVPAREPAAEPNNAV